MRKFTPQNANLEEDGIIEQILEIAQNGDLEITEDDITDYHKQSFVEIYYELMFDGISNGEDWYGRTLAKRTLQLFE